MQQKTAETKTLFYSFWLRFQKKEGKKMKKKTISMIILNPQNK